LRAGLLPPGSAELQLGLIGLIDAELELGAP